MIFTLKIILLIFAIFHYLCSLGSKDIGAAVYHFTAGSATTIPLITAIKAL